MSRLSRLFLVPLPLLAAANCNDPVSPDTSRGMYVLRTVDGERLPHVAWSTTVDGTATLLADTLWLDGRGGARRHTIVHRTANAYGPEATFDYPNELDYRVDGERFEIGSFRMCPPNASCIANEVGVIDADRLHLRLTWYARDALGVYVRTGVED